MSIENVLLHLSKHFTYPVLLSLDKCTSMQCTGIGRDGLHICRGSVWIEVACIYTSLGPPLEIRVNFPTCMHTWQGLMVSIHLHAVRNSSKSSDRLKSSDLTNLAGYVAYSLAPLTCCTIEPLVSSIEHLNQHCQAAGSLTELHWKVAKLLASYRLSQLARCS